MNQPILDYHRKTVALRLRPFLATLMVCSILVSLVFWGRPVMSALRIAYTMNQCGSWRYTPLTKICDENGNSLVRCPPWTVLSAHVTPIADRSSTREFWDRHFNTDSSPLCKTPVFLHSLRRKDGHSCLVAVFFSDKGINGHVYETLLARVIKANGVFGAPACIAESDVIVISRFEAMTPVRILAGQIDEKDDASFNVHLIFEDHGKEVVAHGTLADDDSVKWSPVIHYGSSDPTDRENK